MFLEHARLSAAAGPAMGADYTTFDRGRRGPAGGQNTVAGNNFSAGLRSRRGSRATTADACAFSVPGRSDGMCINLAIDVDDGIGVGGFQNFAILLDDRGIPLGPHDMEKVARLNAERVLRL
jgi:hypothetical protein